MPDGRSHFSTLKPLVLMDYDSRLLLTICGLEELDYHSARGVTHVLSILDPDWPELESVWAFEPHHRLTLRFNDAIEPSEELTLPTRDDVEAILEFGRNLNPSASESDIPHLLVHCHAGRSPDED
jgi:predicted protein tyrosine phosphatase